MLKIVNLFTAFFLPFIIVGQAVTINKAFPNGDEELTITFDLSQAKDPRKAGLLNKTNDVFLWSGAGTSASGDAFEYQPRDQTNFNIPYLPGIMTSLGNNKWSIKLTPRQYYNVPEGRIIRKLGLLLKNGAGNAQTEDFVVTLFDSKLAILVKEPSGGILNIERNGTLPLQVKLSKKSEVSITASYTDMEGKNQLSVLETFSAVDSISTNFFLNQLPNLDQNLPIQLTINASAGTDTAQEKIIYQVKPIVNLQKAPVGTALGVNYSSPTSVVLSFLAPQKSYVHVLGDFNEYTKASNYLMNKEPDSDVFWLEIKNLEPGLAYTYQFLVDGLTSYADPMAEKLLDPDQDRFIPTGILGTIPTYPKAAKGIVGILQPGKKPYDWKIKNFKRPANNELIIYELLIRDFTPQGTYKAAQARLPYLKTLGINAIELMPVQEFTGNNSWGYNPIFYMAPDKAYGTENDLKDFIDACHVAGIAVILDVVYNQADEQYPYVKMYFDGNQPAANSPFFNPQATHPFSVFRDFNHESLYTQQIVNRANEYWLREYNLDGYRFDLSKGFTQKVNSDVDAWGRKDETRIKIWKNYYDNIRKVDPTAYVILEHFADTNEEVELSNYGMMLWGNANYDYKDAIKNGTGDLASMDAIRRGWQKPNLIGYMESHDEERLIYEALNNGAVGTGGYTVKNLNNALERAKAAAAIFFVTDGPKMIWQFGEMGYDISINNNGRTGNKPVLWEYADEPNRKKLIDTYQSLIALKKHLDARNEKVYRFNMGTPVKQATLNSADLIMLVMSNMDIKTRELKVSFPNAGSWFDYMTGSEISVTDLNPTLDLKPGEFHIYTNKKLPFAKTGLVPWESWPLLKILANEEGKKMKIKLSPNPVKDLLTFEITKSTNPILKARVIDLSGKIILEQLIKQKDSINLSGLKTGTYILELEDKKGIKYREKLVKLE